MKDIANNSSFGACANAGTDSDSVLPRFVPPTVSPVTRGRKWHKRR